MTLSLVVFNNRNYFRYIFNIYILIYINIYSNEIVSIETTIVLFNNRNNN